jgi:hypothetical protein
MERHQAQFIARALLSRCGSTAIGYRLAVTEHDGNTAAVAWGGQDCGEGGEEWKRGEELDQAFREC